MTTALEMFQTESTRSGIFANDPECAMVNFIKNNFKRYEKLVDDDEWASLEPGFPVPVISQLLSTNAYGKIRFHPATLGYRNPAHYARLADTPEAAKAALELMTKHWKLTEPKEPGLVISVLGGGKLSCLSDSQTREIFNRGLARAIRSTNGWLLTYGLNSGVSKAVGAVVEEGRSFEWNESTRTDRSLQCIGIVPWQQIKNRQKLIADESSKTLQTVDYYVDPCVRLDEPVSLNPNHSHFLMLEDGSNSVDMETGSAPLFRSELEKLIAMPEDKGGLDVPVVCLMVEGGLRSLNQLLRSLELGLPAVILQNSGRCSDLLADALRKASFAISAMHSMDQYEQEDHLRPILEGLIDKFAVENDYSDSFRGDLEGILVKLCTATYRDQLTVFKIGCQSNLSLDEVLLLRVLDSVKDQNPWKQLKLAQKWKRPDVARRILNDPRFSFAEQSSGRKKLMKRFSECLIRNQFEFVELFVDFGIPVQEYLTPQTLCHLYQQAFTVAPHVWARLFSFKKKATESSLETIRRKDMRPGQKVTLSSINKLFRSFGRRFSHPEYTDDRKSPFTHPYQELFYWAVILNRQQLAELFWQKCEEPLTIAIVGTVLCSWLSSILRGNLNAARQRSYAMFKERLESLAVHLVNQAYKTNKKKAMLLIHRKSQVWAQLDCMSLAALAKDQKFLSTECCQFSIGRTWKHGYTASQWRMIFSIITPFLTPWIINFRSNLPRLCRCPPGRCTCRRDRQGTGLWSDLALKAALLGHARVGGMQQDSEDEELNYVSNQDFDFSFQYSKSLVSTNGTETTKQGKKKKIKPYVTMPSEIQQEMQPPSLIDSMQKRMTLGLWAKRIFIFYYSPAIKFINHTLWYMFYLLLYTFVLLYTLAEPIDGIFPRNIHWSEYLLYFWQLTFVIEELRIILWYPGDKFRDKMFDWWHFSSLATWNHFDLLTQGFSIIIFILRWFPVLFPLVRLFLVINLILYVLRIFKMYFINDYLGPKVVMIKRMSKDLLMFFLVLIVFLTSYSVAYQALFYGTRTFEINEMGALFRYGVWEIFGEFDNPDDVSTAGTTCNKTLFNFTIGHKEYEITDCILRLLPVKILLAAYLFFVNILLVNMLIATFAHVFEEIQANSEEVWKFEMYFLLEEFRSKPLLPSPLIIIEHGFLGIRTLLNLWRARKRHADFAPVTEAEFVWGQRLNLEELHFLSVFECVCRADFIENDSKNFNAHCSCSCSCQGCTMVRSGLLTKPVDLSSHGFTPNKNLTTDSLRSRDIDPPRYQYLDDQDGDISAIKRKRFANIKKF